MTQHQAVLRDAAIDVLALAPGMAVVDATLGGGGYACAIAARVCPGGRVLALDRDATAIARFRTAHPDTCVETVHANFAHIAHIAHDWGVVPQAIVADLGISSDQLDDAARGLSFRADGPLDMRLDRTGAADGERPTAAQLIATLSEERLRDLLRRYGDEPHAARIARAIVAARREAPITRTRQLAAIISAAVPQRRGAQRVHVATRTFQALRIAVNDECAQLAQFIEDAFAILAPGGVLAIVSFHSGEDRIVKHAFRALAAACTCPPRAPICTCDGARGILVTPRRGITPSVAECAENPRARSARLRAIKKRDAYEEKTNSETARP